jgi:hypothetical protein
MQSLSELQSFKNNIKPFFEKIDPFFNEFLETVKDNTLSSDFLSNPLYIEYRDKILLNSEKYLEDRFENINFQILKGDYINDSFISEIDKYIDEIKDVFDLFSEIFGYPIKDDVFKKLEKSIKYFLDSLTQLKKLHSNLWHNKSNNIRFTLSTTTTEVFDYKINEIFKLNISLELFFFNVYLIKVDHFLNISNVKLIENLELIYSRTKEIESEKKAEQYVRINNLIQLKANFLKKKVLLRKAEEIITNENLQKTEGKSNNNKLFLQSKEDFTEFSSLRIINTPKLESFKDWFEYIINHYGIDSIPTDSNIERSAIIKSFDNYDELNLLEIHTQIKYNKDILSITDIDKAFINLNNIKEHLRKLLSLSETDTFEEYYLIANTTYCYNNILSLLKDYKKGQELLDIYNELFNINRLKERQNYFATGIILNYYADVLEEIFLKENIYDDLNECEEILNQCKKLLDKYNEEVKWFENHNNYIYILPINEATIKVESDSLYIFSSFVLPTSSNYLRQKFNKPVNDIKLYQTTFTNIKTLKSSIDKFSNLELSFKSVEEDLKSYKKVLDKKFKVTTDKIEAKETKAIETIVIVSAIMTFVAASIQGFKFIDSGKEAIYFTLALGSSLALFSLVFYIIMRIDIIKQKNEKSIKSYMFFFLTMFVIIGGIIYSWYLLYNFSSKKLNFKEEDPNKINIENTIDFKHQNNNVKIDSLKSKN